MAIYRPPKPRWPLAIATGAVGIFIGVLIGLVVGGNDADPVEAAEEARSALVSAAGTLEVVAIEYEESVDGGTVVKEAEYRGALDALESSRRRFEGSLPAIEVLAPNRGDELAAGYEELERLMSEKAEPQQVETTAEDLAEMLKV
jgi:hypothetical protein